MTVLPTDFATTDLLSGDFAVAAGVLISATLVIYGYRKIYNLITKS